MTINSTSHTIESVFGTRYSIDFYQRDYKWTSSQIETLLSDVFFKFESDYKPELDADVATLSSYGWYYLSTFVTNQDRGRKFIVDGQQRLTTLTLFIIKLYHMANDRNLETLAYWLKTKTCGAEADGNTYWMGADNRSVVLDALFTDKQLPPSAEFVTLPLSLRNMYANYEVASRFLEDKLDTEHRLHAFVLYFMRRVQLVELEINDSKDVAMVFEVINDRGERLQPYEVFKGELLGQLQKSEVPTYLSIWERSITALQDMDQKEPNRFFQLLFRSKDTNNRSEYSEFEGEYQRVVFSSRWNERLHLKRNPNGVKDFLKLKVEPYSAIYRDLLKMNKQEGTYVFFNGALNEHDRQFLLVLSSINANDPNIPAKIDLVARLFDRNYSLLQLMGCYNTNRFTDSIIALNSAIRGCCVVDIQNAFDQQLLADIHAAKGIEVADPFQWSLFRNTGYDLGSRFLRYFFARVEHFIGAGSQHPVSSYYDLVRNYGATYGHHIEHILADNSENRALFANDDETFYQQRNRLGGLLLLKGKDNIKSSNEPYQEKLKTYSAATLLAKSLTSDFYHVNTGFSAFISSQNLAFEPLPDFGQTEVENRQELFFEIAKRIWGDSSFPFQRN